MVTTASAPVKQQVAQAAPIPEDVKSVSTATPIVPRDTSFGAAPDAVDKIAGGLVKEAAQVPPPSTDPTPEDPQRLHEAQPESRTVRLQRLLETLIRVEELQGGHFLKRGVCKKCGWQTMQLDDEQARTSVRQHVQQHWRDMISQL